MLKMVVNVAVFGAFLLMVMIFGFFYGKHYLLLKNTVTEKHKNSPIQASGLVVTADDLIAVRENRKFLYFWGRADYRDIFDGSPDHVTRFSMRVRDFRGDPAKEWNDKTNIVEIIMDNSPARHNCADEDCE
jgi:hypothetical protein